MIDAVIASSKYSFSNEVFCVAVSPLVSGGGPLSDSISLCLLHGIESTQPCLCGSQSSGE